jgi:hypothetical protein
MPAVVADTSRRVKRVCLDPAKYGISEDLAKQTLTIISGRNSLAVNVKERHDIISKVTVKEKKGIEVLVLENRHKAWILLGLKIDEALKDKGKRNRVSLGEIAKVAGIVFDKGQLIDGKATEHVAVMSALDKRHINPQEAMNAVMKMREINESQSDDRN